MRGMRIERLDQLGMVAGICREIGLAEYLDALAGPSLPLRRLPDAVPSWAGKGRQSRAAR